MTVSDVRELDRKRLAFGQVAELYDRARPSYPAEVMQGLVQNMALQAGGPILEVGAGTGKATVQLAARGLRVIGLEPDQEMASVARRKCAGLERVSIVESDFEHWPIEESFPALISAQAWHWIDPGLRHRKAAEAVSTGGTLAALWMFPAWERCALREAFSRAYEAAPELVADFSMHPDSQPDRLAGDWEHEIAQCAGFQEPVVNISMHSVRWLVPRTRMREGQTDESWDALA
ncbi:MAG: class I SAM-dependent methyltransferase [Solirubrobacteraceae bacterium]